MNPINNTIIIVSGLPRSGTSLMMQILEAMGIPIFSDNRRVADKSNPKGYYEHELVKTIENDKSWLPKAKGKAVKIVSNLLIHLPDIFNYKIIFIQRDLDEIIKSQNKMLLRTNNKHKSEDPNILKNIFRKNLNQVKNWQRMNSKIDLLYTKYRDVIYDSDIQINRIANFLDIEIKSIDFKSIILPELYRTKI